MEHIESSKQESIERKDIANLKNLYLKYSRGIEDKELLEEVKIALSEWIEYLNEKVGEWEEIYSPAFWEALTNYSEKLRNEKHYGMCMILIDRILHQIHFGRDFLDYFFTEIQRQYPEKYEEIMQIKKDCEKIREVAAELSKKTSAQEHIGV